MAHILISAEMEGGKQKDYVSENDILATIEQRKKIYFK